jgi:hypothetical protein
MAQEKKLDVIVTVRPVCSKTISGDSSDLKKLRDDEEETVSQISSAISFKDVEAGKRRPKFYRRGGSRSLSRWFGAARPSDTNKGQMWCRWVLVVVVVLGLFGVIAGM